MDLSHQSIVPEMNGDAFDFGMNNADKFVSKDVIDLLPSDPFDMGMSTTFTTITSWLENLEYRGFGYNFVGNNSKEYNLFAGLNLFWTNATLFQCSPGDIQFNHIVPTEDGKGKDKDLFSVFFQHGLEIGSTLQSANSSNANHFRETGENVETYSYADTGIWKKQRDLGLKSSSSSSSSTDINHFEEMGKVDESYLDEDEGESWIKYKELFNIFLQHDLGFRSILESVNLFNKESGIKKRSHVTKTDGKDQSSDEEGGEPHDALQYALRFLSVQDLFNVKRVCKSLNSAVQTDPTLWMTIVISYPLCDKITDDSLVELTSKANGKLQSLTLLGCPRVTENGIKRVLETNSQLKKLNVTRCIRINIDGFVNTMKKLKSESTLHVKHLRIGGLYGIEEKHFKELKHLLGTNTRNLQNNYKPRIYNGYHYELLCDDDVPIDVEECPKCREIRTVYDCPTRGCQGQNGDVGQVCRGCRICIPRCIECGRCIDDREYEETFFFDLHCSVCMKPSFSEEGGNLMWRRS